MDRDFDMPAERWDSLLKTAGVDKDKLKVAYMHGPCVVPYEDGHLLLLDTDKHAQQWYEYMEE